MSEILAERRVYFTDKTEFEGLTFLENGGVWCIERFKPESIPDKWCWYPGHAITVIVREQGE